MQEVMIDELAPCSTSPHWRYPKSCHMFCRDLDALHRFARRLGLCKAWFQDKLKLPHYDLNESRRNAALAAGAVAVTRQRVAEEMEYWRGIRLHSAAATSTIRKMKLKP